MSVLFVLLPVALVLAAISVCACLWAVRSGQYDDTDTPQLRMLKDDPKQP